VNELDGETKTRVSHYSIYRSKPSSLAGGRGDEEQAEKRKENP